MVGVYYQTSNYKAASGYVTLKDDVPSTPGWLYTQRPLYRARVALTVLPFILPYFVAYANC